MYSCKIKLMFLQICALIKITLFSPRYDHVEVSNTNANDNHDYRNNRDGDRGNTDHDYRDDRDGNRGNTDHDYRDNRDGDRV